MQLHRTSSLLIFCALVPAGCGESHVGEPDAAIVFDATFPDTGTDSGPPPSIIGARCTADEDCGEGAAYCESGLGGYCTAVCALDEDCPAGATCVQVSRTTSLCLASCDPSSATDQCQPGNGCTGGGPGFPPVCLPGCEDDTDCGDASLECIEGGGSFGAGVCVDQSRPLGGPCRADGECPPGAECATQADSDFPGGTCILFGCDDVANTGCPNDAECLPTQFGGGICWDGCNSDADCRSTYECVASGTYPDREVCQPRFVPENLGQICSAGRGSCAGGVCFTETQTGFPDSYCVADGCTPGATDSGCPSNGVCVPTTDGGGLCVLACSADGPACRTGYACRPIDASDPTSATACLPGCTEDAHCTGVRRDGTRHVCNPGTGYCLRPFATASLGEPCATGTDCNGGRCMTEADDGWPAGTCTYPGCRLSGEGPAATCPSGGVCTDDGGGDPTLGVCVDACTVGTSSCRPGYACVALEEGGTEGACRPACATGSCGTGRTCDSETGLCG